MLDRAMVDPAASTVEIAERSLARRAIKNRTASDLSGFNASPFSTKHWRRAVTQLSSCMVALADDILHMAIYNSMSSAYCSCTTPYASEIFTTGEV